MDDIRNPVVGVDWLVELLGERVNGLETAVERRGVYPLNLGL